MSELKVLRENNGSKKGNDWIGQIININLNLFADGHERIFQENEKFNREKKPCFSISKGMNSERSILTSYFIGVDWIEENVQAVYVEPKLNKDNKEQTNYLQMLFSALKHPEVSSHTEDLFEIKFDKPYIEIDSQQDLLTPLLIVQFLQIVKQIVRKGLKKSYYKVENNLYSKVKGKLLVSKTIKQNTFKNKTLHSYCSYDEFGVNCLENRLLKKALVFIRSYLPKIKNLNAGQFIENTFNYILPAFNDVSEDVEINTIKHSKANAFFKEYSEGIRLAKLILKRFGYNIVNTQSEKIKVPPFWIDMSKLFELYVLGLLKDRFGRAVTYHFTTNRNELDYLLNTDELKIVIDAKYKLAYNNSSIIEDMRQISGYARLKSVYKELDIAPKSNRQPPIIDCLIIFPDQNNGQEDIKIECLKTKKISRFMNFFKYSIKLPL
ncbi:MAG TPA: hypothetical protein PKK42_19220, partial [Leptospiraceae bacterium]|nr:hypothetical protein [Leptospiraceae bacterium]